MPKSYKTTKKHFKLFKRECRYWLDRFDLGSWEAHFVHGESDHPDTNNSRAWFYTNWTGRLFTIGLSSKWNLDIKKKGLSKCAFHEVCEILLGRLHINSDIDACPTQKDDNDEVTHAIIRRLEKAIWGSYWDAK